MPAAPQFEPPAGVHRKSNSTGWVVGIILLCCLGFVVICCGGGALLVNFGMGIIAVEVQDQLAETEEFREHIGPIESFEPNWTRTASEASSDDEMFVYDVQGEQGSGYVIVKQHTGDDGMEVVEEAELVLTDGTRVPIDMAR